MAEGPFRKVQSARVRSGQTIIANFHITWWELTLECGHDVDRPVRWLPQKGPKHLRRRGWAALYNPPGPDRLPRPPKRARCDRCARDNTIEMDLNLEE